MTLFITVVGLVLALGILMALFKGDGAGRVAAVQKPKYNYTCRRYLMTRAESECFETLMHGIGDRYYIFAQVHLPEIVSEKVGGQNWRAARAHIDRKSVDFVICDKAEVSPLLAIELDDWSHNREDRQERDREVERILEVAGLPLLRITDMEDLVGRVDRKLTASATL